MANIKKIELVDVERWDSTSAGWVKLFSVVNSGEPTEVETVVLYTDATGFSPNSTGRDFKMIWSSFNNGSEDAHSIFGDETGQIPSTAKSQKLRYKIKTTSAGTPDVEVTSAQYYYQMVKLALPTTGVISGLPASATGTISASIMINFPGISSEMVFGTGDAAQDVQALLLQTQYWTVGWGVSGGQKQTLSFSGLDFVNTVSSDVTEFDGTIQALKGSVTLPVSTSGTYELTITFKPNDKGAVLVCAQTLTCSASVTVNTGTQEKILYSIDGTVQFSMQFTS